MIAAVHPNAWFKEGPWNVRRLLGDLTEAGLLLPAPETETWKAALVAADAVIGDHGSLTLYAAHLGTPVLLGAFSDTKVAPGSPMARLGATTARLTDHPLPEQLAALPRPTPQQSAQQSAVTSHPGEAAALHRRLFYRSLDLPEPPYPARTLPIPLPESIGADPRLPVLPPMYVTVSPTAPDTVLIRRHPARLTDRQPTDSHLVADRHDPDPTFPGSAELLLLPADRTFDTEWADLAGPFRLGAPVIALEQPDHACLLLLPNGQRRQARWESRPAWADFTHAASALHRQLLEHPAERTRLTLTAGADMPPGVLLITPA
ncbi:hypothetical protein ACFQ0T_34220 [Kitasatospora gansuensis]